MPKMRRNRWLANAVLQNPILVQAAGLTPVIVATTSLQGAVWVSAVVALHLIICELLAASAMKRVPSWLRVAVYFAIGLCISCPAAYLLDRLTANYTALLHVFMPLGYRIQAELNNQKEFRERVEAMESPEAKEAKEVRNA